MKIFISKKLGMWMAIGGGITFIVSIVVVLVSRLPMYNMAGCIETVSDACKATGLDEGSATVHAAAWLVKAAIVVIVAGAIVMLLADAQKEIRDKK